MKAMILAAGLGTRLRPQTLTVPKPAIPFLNVPLAAFGLENILPLNPSELVVNTFHLPDLVENLFTVDLKNFSKPVQFSHEDDFIRGSGGGLKLAEKYFANESDLILMNSDEVFLPENIDFLKQAYVQHQKQNSISTLITMNHHEVGQKFGGIWTDSNNQVLGFGKNKITGSSSGQHFIGIQILSARIFKYLTADKECNILYDGLDQAMKAKEKCMTFQVEGEWFETGNVTDYLKATKHCLEILKTESKHTKYLKQILTRWSPQWRFLEKNQVLILSDLSSQFNLNQISEFAVIGAGTKINPRCKIQGSVIGSHIEINTDCAHDLKLGNIF